MSNEQMNINKAYILVCPLKRFGEERWEFLESDWQFCFQSDPRFSKNRLSQMATKNFAAFFFSNSKALQKAREAKTDSDFIHPHTPRDPAAHALHSEEFSNISLSSWMRLRNQSQKYFWPSILWSFFCSTLESLRPNWL